jgi:hypothetical protein
MIRDIRLAVFFPIAFLLANADVHTGIVSFFLTHDIIGHFRSLFFAEYK